MITHLRPSEEGQDEYLQQWVPLKLKVNVETNKNLYLVPKSSMDF